MSNKQLIERKVTALGFKLGGYSDQIDKLSRYQINKILKELDQEYTDVDVSLNRQPYVIEIATVDNEKDVVLISKDDYTKRYGSERWDSD